MLAWSTDTQVEKRPEVISVRNLALALLIHLAAFISLYVFAVLHGFFEPKETIIPIDLTVIVNENLNGEENKPPPLKNPEPPPPKPKPQPKPKPKPVPKPEPKALEQIVTNVVKTVEKKEEKKEPKKEPPKPKEDPKKALEERLKKMRESATKNKTPVKIEVKDAKASDNGKTAKQNMSKAEIEKLLNQGYKPGTENQLAQSDLQLGVSRIQMALNDKWEQLSPTVGNSGTVLLSCKISSSGGLINVSIAKSCGDSVSDKAALSVARSISSIRGLPEAFIARFRKETLTIRYDVRGR